MCMWVWYVKEMCSSCQVCSHYQVVHTPITSQIIGSKLCEVFDRTHVISNNDQMYLADSNLGTKITIMGFACISCSPCKFGGNVGKLLGFIWSRTLIGLKGRVLRKGVPLFGSSTSMLVSNPQNLSLPISIWIPKDWPEPTRSWMSDAVATCYKLLLPQEN